MIKAQFMQGLQPLFEELKFYAENDQPHPRKVETTSHQSAQCQTNFKIGA